MSGYVERTVPSVRRADEILVVEHGRIVQRGSATSLLAQPGPFRRLAETLTGAAA